uniref:GOLD domain-containing protein n=1 Tax=Strongyloides stercoralis TaxID=6248 RepID=A0A0K0E0G4_STRER
MSVIMFLHYQYSTILWLLLHFMKGSEQYTCGKATNLMDLSDDGMFKNNLKRVEDFIIMDGVKENVLTLNCFYITPNGNINLIETFMKEKRTFIRLNDKGEEIYETKSKDDKSNKLEKKLAEKNRQLAGEMKTLFEKFKDKLGGVDAYAVINETRLVGCTAIFILWMLVYIKVLEEWIVKKGLFKKE